MNMRDLQNQILANIPRVLSLLDKNPYSKSYGCLDRKFWQYKIIDFPSGMQQELIAPLAYVYSVNFTGNPYFACPRIHEYLSGILRFHATSINADGSLDDYFPRERALGATAYAMAAIVRAYASLKKIPEGDERRALELSASFLIRHQEAGTLANHHAIAAYVLTALGTLLKAPGYYDAAKTKTVFLQTLQHDEGWFIEYEGCDIGYQTVTLEFLARAYAAGGPVPRQMLDKLLSFLRDFVHPDGSLGGEYGSRNTFNFYPGGCAVLSSEFSAAAELLGYFMRSMELGSANHLADDGTFGHGLSSLVTVLQAHSLTVTDPAPPGHCEPWLRYYPGAGLYRAGTGAIRMYGNLLKGGCYKVFRQQTLLTSDTGYMGRLENGTVFCQNTPNNARTFAVENLCVTSSGTMQKYNNTYLGRIFIIALRVYTLIFGSIPFFGRILRKIMQAILIYKKKPVPITWSRKVVVSKSEIVVHDTVSGTDNYHFTKLHRTTDAVNIHVVTSSAFQKVNLLPWSQCVSTAAANYKASYRYEAQA